MKDFYEGLSPEDLELIKAMEANMQLAGPDHPSIKNPFTVVTRSTRRPKAPPVDDGEDVSPDSKP